MKSVKIHPKLKEELAKLEQEYIKVTKLAELLPMYTDRIIQEKQTGQYFFKLASYHKQLPLHWGANWFVNLPTNYPVDQLKPPGLISVYINCMSLFNEDLYAMAQSELTKVLPNIKVHFYDNWNTTFYFLPEEVEEGLDKLNEWYISTKAQANAYLKQRKKEQLQQELDKLLREETE